MAKTERIITAELTLIAPEESTMELNRERIREMEKALALAEGFDHVKIVRVQDHTFPEQPVEDKTMRVYISGPITGNPTYMLDFEDAERHLTEQGYIVFNPAAVNSQMPTEITYEEYMEFDMKMLSMCDTIYLLKGWERSRGANREHGYALAKGMKIMKEGEEVWED